MQKFFKAQSRAVVAGLESDFVWKWFVFCRKSLRLGRECRMPIYLFL